MELSAAGPGLATGNITGIYLAGTNQEGTYHDGKGLSSLTINNADGWDNAIKFHSSQDQVENGIYVWKNSGSADLKISGMVDMYVGNGSTASAGFESTANDISSRSSLSITSIIAASDGNHIAAITNIHVNHAGNF